MNAPTLGARLALQDARRFVGRSRELSLIERVLTEEDPGACVVFVHGPGGIGKSTLLREVARRGALAGFDVHTVDGRDFADDPAGLTAALERPVPSPRPLLLIDGYELIAAVGAGLRATVLPGLPGDARVVIAGRRAPEPGWTSGGWEALTLPLALGPLDDADARALLHRLGIEDGRDNAALVRWARGLPLALAVAADAARATDAVDLTASLEDDRAVAQALLTRLAGDELGGADRDVLAVAAIAAAVDARLLAAALPGVDADHAATWLAGLSFATVAGSRIRIHERVAAALRTELRADDPARERDLRRRIGDHLHDRAATGHPALIGELISLIDHPVVRQGFALETGDRYRIDRPRDGDVAIAAAALDAAGTDWWPAIERFFERAPDRVIVARDAAGALAGFAITVTPASAPGWCDADAVLGPWLAHARAAAPDGNAILWRNTFDLTGAPDSTVVGLLNMVGIQRAGLPNVRLIYGHTEAADERAQALSRAIGAVMIPELTVRDRDRVIECHLLDHGPGGILAATRALLHQDLGLPAPPARTPAEVAAAAVRDALRAFHDPVALAASPLAHGATVDARAASVRTMLTQGVDAAFGDSANDRMQAATILLGYFDGGGHAAAALSLRISRSSYFRRLADASDRLARYILSRRG